MRTLSSSITLLFTLVSASHAAEPVWLPVEDLVVDQLEPAVSIKGQPSRKLVLAVRGIYPVGRQLAGLRRDGIADDAFEIIDFELQREEIAADGTDQSHSDWKTLTKDGLREVVTASDGLALDFVDDAQQDTAILAPLPLLAEGAWGSAVMHPRLERGARQFLFRFLDFGVERGRYYRYRVRLEVRNPHYKQPTDDPFLVIGKTRKTHWSQPCAALLIKPEADEK